MNLFRFLVPNVSEGKPIKSYQQRQQRQWSSKGSPHCAGIGAHCTDIGEGVPWTVFGSHSRNAHLKRNLIDRLIFCHVFI